MNPNSGFIIRAAGVQQILFPGIDFTAYAVTISLSLLQSNGIADWALRLGTRAALIAAGYDGAGTIYLPGTVTANATAFQLTPGSAATAYSGNLNLTLLDLASNTWSLNYVLATTAGNLLLGAGSVSLGAGAVNRLAQLAITTTDRYTSGLVNMQVFTP